MAEVFNETLQSVRESITSYNDSRAKVVAMLDEISRNSETLSTRDQRDGADQRGAGPRDRGDRKRHQYVSPRGPRSRCARSMTHDA